MHQFVQFAIHHWMLISLLLFTVVLILREEQRAYTGGALALSPQAAVKSINQEKAVIIDLRDLVAFNAGHISHARSVPFSQLEEKLPKLRLKTDKPILLACKNGYDSGRAAKLLRRQHFTQVSLLAGGIDAWLEAGFPLTKDT